MLYDKKWDKEVKVVDEVGRVLLEAADYIDKHWWAQWFRTLDGRVCAMGAIASVEGCTGYSASSAGNLPNYDNAANRILMALGRPLSAVAPNVVGYWNDERGRTAEEVTALLRYAAYQG